MILWVVLLHRLLCCVSPLCMIILMISNAVALGSYQCRSNLQKGVENLILKNEKLMCPHWPKKSLNKGELHPYPKVSVFCAPISKLLRTS